VKAAVLLAPHAIPDYADFDEPRLTPDRELVELVAAGSIRSFVRSPPAAITAAPLPGPRSPASMPWPARGMAS
jgi:hypothetical protein